MAASAVQPGGDPPCPDRDLRAPRTHAATSHGPSQGARLLASPVRRRIVDTLEAMAGSAEDEATEGMTAAQLAELLDLHVTTVRFHLDQLVVAGILESGFQRRPEVGRPRKVYRAAAGPLPSGDTEGPLRVLTALLTETFGAVDEEGNPLTPAKAGRLWARNHVPADESGPAETPGAWLGKVGRMIDVLHEWGYTPTVTTADHGRTAQISLHHCPFVELADANPAVVCGVHRGLIAGAMEQLGEDDTVVSLQPFVEPGTCLAHVTTRHPFVSGRSGQPSRLRAVTPPSAAPPPPTGGDR